MMKSIHVSINIISNVPYSKAILQGKDLLIIKSILITML